jgi:hypothetical protein
MHREIYCCGCSKDVQARLTDGAEIYPHRPDLFWKNFWICDTCKNSVGCHNETDDPRRPLGIIATREIKAIRQRIHAILDPIWKTGAPPLRKKYRRKLYAKISEQIGYDYHTAEIKNVSEGERIIGIIKDWGDKNNT